MNFLKEVFNLLFPDLCVICENPLTLNEETICVLCRVDLPFTYFSSEPNNVAERAFYGRIKLEAVTSLFYFRKKGKGQKLIHQLKYKNQQKIGILSGQLLAEEMKNNK